MNARDLVIQKQRAVIEKQRKMVNTCAMLDEAIAIFGPGCFIRHAVEGDQVVGFHIPGVIAVPAADLSFRVKRLMKR